MNENLEKDKIQLGSEKPQLLPSKSLLNTIKLGYNVKPASPPSENHIDFIEGDSVMTTISTGFEHNDKPVPPPPEINLSCKVPKKKNPDSVIGSIDTGFGCDNQIVIDCPKPKYKTHLCKENYLGEFKTESEKTLARNNLGIYSKEEIDSTVNNSYSSMVIKPENAPILVLDDIVNQMQDELYIKMVIKELLDNCDLEKLNTIYELNKKDKNRVIKVMKNYIKDNEKEIKKQKQSLDDLKKLLTEEE